eukprot:Nk52_evm10s319 gene=Nk52_evmTU10s319
MNKTHIGGLTAAVVWEDEDIFHEHFGCTGAIDFTKEEYRKLPIKACDVDHIRGNTHFMVGSFSSFLTALGTHNLLARRGIPLTTPLIDILSPKEADLTDVEKRFPRQLCLWHLMSGCSGLRDETLLDALRSFGGNSYNLNPRTVKKNKGVVELKPLRERYESRPWWSLFLSPRSWWSKISITADVAPGVRRWFNTHDSALLALVIEKLCSEAYAKGRERVDGDEGGFLEGSGLSFEEYMEEWCFRPLGMKDTTFITPEYVMAHQEAVEAFTKDALRLHEEKKNRLKGRGNKGKEESSKSKISLNAELCLSESFRIAEEDRRIAEELNRSHFKETSPNFACGFSWSSGGCKRNDRFPTVNAALGVITTSDDMMMLMKRLLEKGKIVSPITPSSGEDIGCRGSESNVHECLHPDVYKGLFQTTLEHSPYLHSFTVPGMMKSPHLMPENCDVSSHAIKQGFWTGYQVGMILCQKGSFGVLVMSNTSPKTVHEMQCAMLGKQIAYECLGTKSPLHYKAEFSDVEEGPLDKPYLLENIVGHYTFRGSFFSRLKMVVRFGELQVKIDNTGSLILRSFVGSLAGGIKLERIDKDNPLLYRMVMPEGHNFAFGTRVLFREAADGGSNYELLFGNGAYNKLSSQESMRVRVGVGIAGVLGYFFSPILGLSVLRSIL